MNAKFEIFFLCNKDNDGVCITTNSLSRLKFSPNQKFQAVLKKNIHSDMLDYKRRRELQEAWFQSRNDSLFSETTLND